jgi:hypothetical protein
MVVDGGSGDGSAEALSKGLEHPDYRGWTSLLPLTINGGYGWANNQAMLTLASQEIAPDFFHVLNPDAEVEKGAVAALLHELEKNPRCAAAGSQLIWPDGTPAPSAFRFPSPGREFARASQSEVIRRALGIDGITVSAQEGGEVDWVTGASVMFRAAALRETGLFDDGFFLYFEEVELMHRLSAKGWTIRHAPESRVVHAEGAATGVGAATVKRPLPAYWYRSRRRYFELTGGAATLAVANFCSLAGQAIAGLKRALHRPVASKAYRTADLFRYGFWPSATSKRRSAPNLGDAPGRPPAWMST